MAIEKMKLVKISGKMDSLNPICDAICKCGCFEPDTASKYISASMGFVSLVEENPYSSSLSKIEEIADSVSAKLSFMDEKITQDIGQEDTEYLEAIQQKLHHLYTAKTALQEQKDACLLGIQKYEHFKGMEVNLDALLQCEFVKVRFGHLPKESFKKIETIFKDNPYVFFHPCSEDKTDYWGVYFAPIDKVDEIDSIFAFLLFVPFSVPGAAGTVDEVIAELQHSIEIINHALQETEQELQTFWKQESERCNHLYTNLVRKNAMYILRSYALHNGKTFVLAGYVPLSDASTFKEALQKIPNVSLELQEPPTEDITAIPVKTKSKCKLLQKLVSPYHFYVDMYGTPAYTDIDITPFVALTYTLLFGIMFGDLGQGFVLSILGFLMWKLKKLDLGKILVPCGISSMVFGFVFGSVFGYEDLLDPLYHAMGLAHKPISVMDSINTVLLVAIGIGVGLMVIAMLLHIYASIRQKEFGEAIFGQNGLVGLILYLSGCNLASGFMGGPAPLPTATAGTLLGVCAVLLIIKEIPIGLIDKHKDWKPEHIFDFILQNFFELLEYILSYLSNTVSFLRVGAFVLVHAGMMMVVFSLAGESQNIFVIVLGNVIVIALEGLLTGIQALRLEYYEMFSRFYVGGGKPFHPISLTTKSENQ